MNEEKMKVLKMLEDGRISSEDAARLLESLKEEPPTRGRQNPGRASETTSPNKFDGFAADISKKFVVLAKDMEPKIQKLSEVVAEKTANVADRISKSLAKDNVSEETPPLSSSEVNRSHTRCDSEKVQEIIVSPGSNELHVTGIKGNVTIKGYNGNKITAKIYAKQKNAGSSKDNAVEFMQLGSKYVLHYKEELFETISVDAYVPECFFQNIQVETNNGVLDVSNLKSKSISVVNSNGNTRISQITTENIKVDANNGGLDLSDIFAENGKIENFNGDINATDLDIADLNLMGLNGSLTLLVRALSRYGDYAWAVETSNGRITANLPSGEEYGYHIKAQTALSEVRVGLTGLSYSANSPTFVEARSFRFNESRKKMKISLETSSYPLTIN